MQNSLRFWALLLAGLVASLHATVSTPAPAAKRFYYAVVVNHDGLLLDEAGAPVPVAQLPAYLEKPGFAGIDTIALLIAGPDTIKSMEPTIAAFGGRFAKIIVKHREPSDRLGRLEFPASGPSPLPGASGIAHEINIQRLPMPATSVPPASTSTPNPPAPAAELRLTAGQSAILVGGQRIYFPAGTTVCMPGGSNVTVRGHQNTVSAGPGAIVAVPLNATGEADNVVIAP